MHLLALILVAASSLHSGITIPQQEPACYDERAFCLPLPCPEGYVPVGECMEEGYACCVPETTIACGDEGSVCHPLPCPEGYAAVGECMDGFACCAPGTTVDCEDRGGKCVPDDECYDHYELAGSVGDGPLCENGEVCCGLCEDNEGTCMRGSDPCPKNKLTMPCPENQVCCDIYGRRRK